MSGDISLVVGSTTYDFVPLERTALRAVYADVSSAATLAGRATLVFELVSKAGSPVDKVDVRLNVPIEAVDPATTKVNIVGTSRMVTTWTFPRGVAFSDLEPMVALSKVLLASTAVSSAVEDRVIP